MKKPLQKQQKSTAGKRSTRVLKQPGQKAALTNISADSSPLADDHNLPAPIKYTVSREQVQTIYQALLGRPPESEAAIEYHMRSHLGLEAFRDFVLTTPQCIEYLSARIVPGKALYFGEAAEKLTNYSYFFFVAKEILGTWHNSYFMVLALYQFLNAPDRNTLVERMQKAAKENDDIHLLSGTVLGTSQPQRFYAPAGVQERYQDVRLPGQTFASGVRGCEERYQFIRSVASQFNRPFSVLDLGANLGYFAVRLVEEFDCFVVCCEGIYASWLRAIVSKSARGRIVVLAKTITIEDLEELAECESFDLVLAMSVVHHLATPVPRTIHALRRLGWKLIVELPTEATACGQARVAESMRYDWQSEGGVLIGEATSHLPGQARPTILMEGQTRGIIKPYMYAFRECNLAVHRDWNSATIEKSGELSPYLPAFNLHSYFSLNGI
jgi:SAM-dependent methyltransferase